MLVYAVAYWILFRLLVVFPNKESLRCASALVLTISVNGQHYAGMAAARFVYENPDDVVTPSRNVVIGGIAIGGAIIAGLGMSILGLTLALSDLRGWFFTMAQVMRELDMVRETYELKA